MNLDGLKVQAVQVEKLFREDMDSLNFVIKHLRENADVENYVLLQSAESGLDKKKIELDEWRLLIHDKELEMTAELMNVKGKIYQLPIAFLFVIIWLSLFGGLILAVVISYFGNTLSFCKTCFTFSQLVFLLFSLNSYCVKISEPLNYF